jgi:hypothetical protein
MTFTYLICLVVSVSECLSFSSFFQASGGILQSLDLSRCKQLTDLGLMGLESRSHRASLASLNLSDLPRCSTASLAFLCLGLGRSKKEQQVFLKARFLRRRARAKQALLEGGFLLKTKPGAAQEEEEESSGEEDESGSEFEDSASRQSSVGTSNDGVGVKKKRPKPKLPSMALFKYGKPKDAEKAPPSDEWEATAPTQAPEIPPLNIYAVGCERYTFLLLASVENISCILILSSSTFHNKFFLFYFLFLFLS